MKAVSVFALVIASMVAASSPAIAQGNTSASTHPHKKVHVRKSLHSTQAKKAEDPEPSVAGKLPINFNCELGDKLTIYRSPGDDKHIALRWHKHLHEMTRVLTTTGAERFENATQGLVWIGIPAKSMLLDSKQGHQLANECRDVEQEAALRSTQHLAGVRH